MVRHTIPLSVTLLVLLAGLSSASETSGQIDFHVSIVGDGVLHPGDDTVITVLIENEGKVSNFLLNENTSQLLTLLTTAKDLRVEIEDRWIPIEVRTLNPQLIGDLPGGRVAQAKFRIKIDENAEPGDYRIPVKLRYTKVTYSESSSGTLITYHEGESDTDYLKIKIARKDYDFSIESVESALKTNQEGIVRVTVENTGNNRIYNATLTISCTTPLQSDPEAMSAYLGDLNVNGEANAEFKIHVMEGALNASYPAKLILKFRTSDDITKMLSKPVGLKVSDVKTFVITDVESSITTSKTISRASSTPPSLTTVGQQQSTQLLMIPSRGFVSIGIKSNENVSDAVAVLSFDSPLIKAENSPYLGHLKKNGVKKALFYVKSTAPPGKYRAYVILKYKNELGDAGMSEKHYFEVKVSSTPLLALKKVETKNLGVGMRGKIDVELKNGMNCTVRDTTLVILSPDPSITPLSSSYFIDELKPGETGKARFRLSISSNALNGSYRLYLVERYSLKNAEDLVSIAEIPVVVEPGMAYFEVLSIKSNLHPDETGDVVIAIKNTGMEIHNAVVKLDLSPPLTIAGGSSLSTLVGKSQPGLYFIGALKTGDTATARFRVDVDKDAGSGSYPVKISVEYYDDEGYVHTSNPITASVEVREKPLLTPLTGLAITISFAGLALAGKFIRKRLK